MLPFFAAGGAISGSSFGLFYTILMQVGYNYYGKIVLEDIKGGMSLFDALIKVQQDIRPFSDAMMQAALDAMPDTIEKSIDAFSNIITSFGEERIRDLSKSWLLPQDKGDFIGPRQPTFKLPTTKITDTTRRSGLLSEETARERVDRVPLDIRMKEQETREAVKQKAGQSQILERKKLITSISGIHVALRDAMSKNQKALVSHYQTALKREQQLLINLLARYSF